VSLALIKDLQVVVQSVALQDMEAKELSFPTSLRFLLPSSGSFPTLRFVSVHGVHLHHDVHITMSHPQTFTFQFQLFFSVQRGRTAYHGDTQLSLYVCILLCLPVSISCRRFTIISLIVLQSQFLLNRRHTSHTISNIPAVPVGEADIQRCNIYIS